MNKSVNDMTEEELAEQLQLIVEKLGWVMGIPVATKEHDFYETPLILVGQEEMVEEFLAFYDEMLAIQKDMEEEKGTVH